MRDAGDVLPVDVIPVGFFRAVERVPANLFARVICAVGRCVAGGAEEHVLHERICTVLCLCPHHHGVLLVPDGNAVRLRQCFQPRVMRRVVIFDLQRRVIRPRLPAAGQLRRDRCGGRHGLGKADRDAADGVGALLRQQHLRLRDGHAVAIPAQRAQPRHAVRQIGEAQHGGRRGLLRRSRTNGERGRQRIPLRALRAHRQAQRREQQADSQQRNDPFHRHS